MTYERKTYDVWELQGYDPKKTRRWSTLSYCGTRESCIEKAVWYWNFEWGEHYNDPLRIIKTRRKLDEPIIAEPKEEMTK